MKQMKKQEAIDYLNRLRDEVWNEDSDGYEYAKAIDTVIEALSCSEKPNMSDTIYRQDTIDEIEERKNANGYRNVAVISELNRLEGYIMRLPSAQPEIIRCKDCKFWTHIKRTNRYWCKTDDGLYDLNPSPNDFCSRAERRTDE